MHKTRQSIYDGTYEIKDDYDITLKELRNQLFPGTIFI